MRQWRSLCRLPLSTLSRRAETYLQNASVTCVGGESLHRCRSNSFKRTNSVGAVNHSSRFLQTHTATSSDSTAASSGLFSISELQTPRDFAVLTQQAIRDCNQLRSTVAATTHVSTLQDASLLLHQLDDISKTVCNVIDAAELCRSVHADAAWREAAQHAYTVLSDYISLLNADTTLYQALRIVQSNTTIYALLSEEERRFAVLLQAEFERDGIHLPMEQRETVRQLQNTITELEGSFSYNLVHSRNLFTIDNASTVTDIIPTHVLQHYGATLDASQSTVQVGDTDSAVLQTLLKYSSNADLRRAVHWHSVTSTPENLLVLDALVQARHTLATTQGFASYVERNVPDKMARTASAIQSFLQQAARDNQALFRTEMETLSQAKRRVEGDGAVHPWDTSFYVGLLSQSANVSLTDLSNYFTVSHTLASMQLLVERLFGIVMCEEPLSRLEQWDVNESTAISSVRKYSFSFEDEPLGIMYLDLHPREAKYGHAAHFTVRCGCAINISGTHANGSEAYQRPIVALVCNLSSPTGLAHSEVETLLHEFGHALHSLLSRTKFQHMSGTRAALDFVETPSHLLEHFAWDAQFLPLLSRHAVTGEPMSETMIQQLQSTRYQFAALERQNQILHSMFDQKLFGVPQPTSTQDLFASLHETYGIPHVQDTHWYSRFGHLVSYGAGYYGYLYAQGFARQIWQDCFDGRSLDRTAGRNLWQRLLVHGGARDPHAMLTDLLGRPP